MPPRHYSKRPYGIAYHGYYCGPGWSAGEYQNSVSGGPDPIDALDRLCQKHDSQYASGYDRKRADQEFYKAAMKLGYPKAQVAAILVGSQGYFRKEGTQHWSQRPSKIQKTSHVVETPSDKENNLIRFAPRVSEMRMEGLVRHSSFYKKSPGVAGYLGGAFHSNKKNKDNLKHFYKDVFEVQGKADDPQCVYIGHSSVPTLRIAKHAFLSIIRALLHKQGVDYKNMDDKYPGGALSTGYGVISFTLRLTPTAAQITWGNTFTLDDSRSPNITADAMVTAFLSLSATNPQVIFDSVKLSKFGFALNTVAEPDERYVTFNAADEVEMDLHSSIVKIITNGQLKIQNRTRHVATSVDDAETTTAVDAMPLIGKTYFGGATGMWTKNLQSTLSANFIADWNNTLIGAVAAEETILQEPPDASQFCNVKKHGGFKMEPGEIKTSYLNDSIVMNFSKFMRKLAPVFSSIYNVAFGLGHYRIIALEKVIGIKTSGDSEPQVELGWEINFTMRSYCKGSFKYVIAQGFTKYPNVNF